MSRRHPRTHGVILVITLLALILLAGLVVYVLNLGSQVGSRTTTQNAADASAAAGATWVARSFNTVALNNVASARLVALVNILDAMPLSTQFTLEEQTDLRQAVRDQLARGVRSNITSDALATLRGELDTEIEILTPLDQYFNRSGADVSELTFYEGPNGRGQFWLALESMSLYSEAALDSLAVLAQLDAVRGGQVNLGGRLQRGAAMLVPALPGVPWRRGQFDDFQRPVTTGLLPTDVDDKTTHRGPYDTVFGWRYHIGGGIQGHWVGGTTSVATGGHGNVPISGGSGGSTGGRWVTTGTSPPVAYGVYGPYRWLTDHVNGFASVHLRHSRFGHWNATFSDIKLHYLWPGASGDGIKTVIHPKWITSYPQAVSIANAGTPLIHETQFVAVEIKSRFAPTHPNFGAPGSWQYVYERDHARLVRVAGWMDPATWGVPQVGNFIWRDTWNYEVFFDATIGVVPRPGPGGTQLPQRVYRVDEFMFAGINVGNPEDIRNPHNFTDRSALPAPVDFDHAIVKPDELGRRQYLSYLAVAQRDDRAAVWRSTFRGHKPYPNVVAVAQVEVFNNHSWDLWTQMWRSQLTPVRDYQAWSDTMADTPGDDVTAATAAGVSSEDWDNLRQYLHATAPLAEVMLRH